jgi:nitrogen fixation NifU-like protein
VEYSERTLRYYRALQNVGSLGDELKNVGTGIVGSPLCGDVMKLQLAFDGEDRVVDAKYKVFGCVSAIASMEFVTEQLIGMTIEDALAIENKVVADSLELSSIKRHCSVLAKEAIESAIKDYLSKKRKENSMISVTDVALAKLKDLVREQGCLGIYLSVKDGGCSGLEYSLAYETECGTEKGKFEVDGLTIYYDSAVELMIKGTSIEMVESDFGHGFIVTNKSHVGCQNCTCKCDEAPIRQD